MLSLAIQQEVNRILQENDDSFRALTNTKGETVFPITHIKSVITATGENLETLLSQSDLATKEQVDELFFGAYEELDTLKEIGDAIKAGETSEAVILGKIAEAKSSLQEIQTSISEFLTATQISGTYATKVELNDYAKKTDIPADLDLSVYVTDTELTNAISEIDIPDINHLATKEDLNQKIVSISEADYEALAVKIPGTLYIITEEGTL